MAGSWAGKVSVAAFSVVVMDEATAITTAVADPCPNGHLELLELVGARLEEWGAGPARPVGPWRFTD